MRLGKLVTIGLLSLVFTLARSQTTQAQPVPTDPTRLVPSLLQMVIPNQYIVVFRDDLLDPLGVVRELQQRYTLPVAYTYQFALKGFTAVLPPQVVPLLEADPRVLFVAQDRVVQAFAQTLPTGVDRIEADTSATQAGDGTGALDVPAVAVLDTGIDPDHPDLNVRGGKGCWRASIFRFDYGGVGASYDDGNGHGSHVAGTIGARDNGLGVVGVAPGAPLYAVRVLGNDGAGSTSSVVCGIDWVAANAASLGIKVANMSLGGAGSDDRNCGTSNRDAQHKAICNATAAGVLFVVSAGNSNQDLKGFVPAAYNEVLTVTAAADFNGRPGGDAPRTCRTDVDETAADFSNWTTKASEDATHTIAAPGVCIRSTWKDGGYHTISGTSMAAPHVAGTAAVCIASGACTGGPSQILQRLRTDAANRDADNTYGFAEDPNSIASSSRYYGYLVWAGGE